MMTTKDGMNWKSCFSQMTLVDDAKDHGVGPGEDAFFGSQSPIVELPNAQLPSLSSLGRPVGKINY
jgi:hypothetical protein